jgi:hypothetical protein
MRETLTVQDLFRSAGLSPCGPVEWGKPCPEHQKGVYVVVIESEVVYVGRTERPLARRIREFYRHKYGDKHPHQGGQELLKMPGDRLVYWCAAENPAEAETKMLNAFKGCYDRLPRANRRGGDRAQSESSK